MMSRLMNLAWACALALCLVGTAQAAGGVTITDPLTSANPGAFTTDSGSDPLDIVYDAAGAHIGGTIPGDGGRNYVRTIKDNFAQALSFTAEITFETTTDDQAVFFGVGAGQKALFGTPDWSTLLSSASFWPESGNNKFTRFRTQNDHNAFGDTGVAGFDPGTHRFRMTYDKSTQRLLGEIDLNYAGGPFVADPMTTNFPIVVTALFVDNDLSGDNGPGWLVDPSRIFFGGDDGATFRDLVIHCVPEPTTGVILLLGMSTFALGRRRGA